MTDVDDEGLIDQFEVSVIRALSGVNGEPDYDEAKAALADRLEAQAHEIAELKSALAEALKVIAPFASISEHNATFHYTSDIPAWGFNGELLTWGDLRAAAAFAKKHGGKGNDRC
jgi:hypothetical protein